MDEQQLETRRRVLKYTTIVFVVLYTIASWYATQCVAESCQYHPLLGWHISLFGLEIYPPWGYFFWSSNPQIMKYIPNLMAENDIWTTIAIFLTAGFAFLMAKNLKVETSHGSASFATKKDIDQADLGEFMSENGGVLKYKETEKVIMGRTVKKKEKIKKDSGVVVGINPYTHKLMLHNGKEHVLLMAPTRSGKGINTIIPTGLIWRDSIFFFDPKGELWANTAGFRKKYFHQKVLKFEPLCTDGSGARWNPLAEINYRTFEELSDVSTVVSVMVKPNGEKKGGGDPFWDNSAASLLNGVIMHLMYKHHKEHLPLPCPSDIMSFLSSPDTTAAFRSMQRYPHISAEEFLELEIKDENGNLIYDEFGQPKRHKNPLKEIYGEYIKDFTPFIEELGPVNSVEKIRLMLLDRIHKAETKAKENNTSFKISDAVDFQEEATDPQQRNPLDTANPWYRLLTHPKVAECASNMLNGAEQTRASIMQTAQTALAIYQDPVVQANTEVSDFAIRDLLDPTQEVSLYLVMQVKDIATVRPIARLFINTLLNKLIRDMKFDSQDTGKKLVEKQDNSPTQKVSEEKPKASAKSVTEVDMEDTLLNKLMCDMDLPQREDGQENKGKGVSLAKKGQDLTVHPPKKGGQRLLLMLDEFPQLGNMESVELALAICAGYGIKMCIVCQDVNQLNKEYTKDNSIASNCHVHIYFTPNLDPGGATAKAISETLGKRTIKTVSHSDGGGLGKGSDSTSLTGRELMTPDEVAKLSTEKELVFVAGHPPILGDKLRYYLNPILLKRTKLPCPKISDIVTQVLDYDTLFATHAADQREKDEKNRAVMEAKAKRDGYGSLEAYIKHQQEEKVKHEHEITEDSKKSEDDEENVKNDDCINGLPSGKPPEEIEKPKGEGKVKPDKAVPESTEIMENDVYDDPYINQIMSNMKSENNDKPKDDKEEPKYDDSSLNSIDMEVRVNDIREQQQKYHEERMKESADPKSKHPKNHKFGPGFKSKVEGLSKSNPKDSVLLPGKIKKEGEIDADPG